MSSLTIDIGHANDRSTQKHCSHHEMANPDDHKSQLAAIMLPQQIGEGDIGGLGGEEHISQNEAASQVSDEDRKVHLLTKTYLITLCNDDDDGDGGNGDGHNGDGDNGDGDDGDDDNGDGDDGDGDDDGDDDNGDGDDGDGDDDGDDDSDDDDSDDDDSDDGDSDDDDAYFPEGIEETGTQTDHNRQWVL